MQIQVGEWTFVDQNGLPGETGEVRTCAYFTQDETYKIKTDTKKRFSLEIYKDGVFLSSESTLLEAMLQVQRLIHQDSMEEEL